MGKMKTPLLPEEKFIDIQKCTRLGRAGMSWAGTIFVTNQRIIFETNSANSKIKEITDIIDVNEVKEYAYADNFAIGLMIPIPGLSQNKSVSIRTLNGDYRITPTNVEGLMESLRQVCPNAILGEKNSYTEAVKETIFGDKNSDVLKKMGAGVRAGKNMFGNLSGKTRGFETPPAEALNPSYAAPDAAEEIRKYKELLDMGAITEEEFESKKKELIN